MAAHRGVGPGEHASCQCASLDKNTEYEKWGKGGALPPSPLRRSSFHARSPTPRLLNLQPLYPSSYSRLRAVVGFPCVSSHGGARGGEGIGAIEM